jgi:hypothetical protein
LAIMRKAREVGNNEKGEREVDNNEKGERGW